MKLLVYNWELFDRGRWWYIGMITFVVLFVFLNLLYQDIAGIIVFVIFLAGYLYFFLQWTKKVEVRISEEGLYIGANFIPWTSLQGFVLELDPSTKKIKNIVFVKSNWEYLIHTIAEDNIEKIKQFSLELSNYIPMLENYNQSFFDKLIRIFKI
jgi:hypothetical protein